MVGLYVIMPDHIHLLAAPSRLEVGLIKPWVKYVKREMSVELAWGRHHWQENCWDTQIRSGEQFVEKAEYIRNNPVRQGLVKHPDDWPYRGVLNQFVWI